MRPGRTRGRACGPLLACLPLCALALAAAAEGEPLRLRYGWSPGQVWRATHRIERETRVGDDVQRTRGVARFEYVVGAAEPDGSMHLDVRLLSQETEAGASPLDFSAIAFHASIDARGRLRGAHYEIGDTLPASAPDPVATRQLLRQVASAWRDSVFWFPELPDRALAPGDAFSVDETRDLADAEPGVSMRVRTTRSYRLVSLDASTAHFRVEEVSAVDAATAESGIASQQRAEGEAVFDLALGMWTGQHLDSSQRARYSGASGVGGGAGEATGSTRSELEMERVEPPTQPAAPR